MGNNHFHNVFAVKQEHLGQVLKLKKFFEELDMDFNDFADPRTLVNVLESNRDINFLDSSQEAIIGGEALQISELIEKISNLITKDILAFPTYRWGENINQDIVSQVNDAITNMFINLNKHDAEPWIFWYNNGSVFPRYTYNILIAIDTQEKDYLTDVLACSFDVLVVKKTKQEVCSFTVNDSAQCLIMMKHMLVGIKFEDVYPS